MENLDTKYREFYEKVSEFLPKERLFTDYMHNLAYGTDGSFYRLTPKIVVIVENGDEAQRVIQISNTLNIPIVFRAAGSSVSGQSITDSVLVTLSRDWRGVEIKDGGETITMKPATIGEVANIELERYGKRLGADPASIRTAFISGIVANNASGMSAGVANNSYNTLKDIKVILSDGFRLDSADKDSKEKFKSFHKKIYDEIASIKEEIKKDKELYKLIDRKSSIKNTCGYYLRSFLDFEDPIEIISHLFVGSEGTLGFIEEVTFSTVEHLPKRASALAFFKNLKEGAKAIQKLHKIPREQLPAAELMDRKALKSVENEEGLEYLKDLDEKVSAILLESAAKDEKELKEQIEKISKELEEFNMVLPLNFSDDKEVYNRYWDIRKGMFPKVCSLRKPGTSVFIEDVAFPMDSLDEAIVEVDELLKKHGYNESIIFGHALDGNIHFIVISDLTDKNEVVKYEKFMDEIVHLVAKKYNGSLKAEHGTGRNMAPFVEFEWGEKAYSIMKRVKNIFDPKNLLNPDVLISKDKTIHLKNFKSFPIANPLIDLCIECGFCEPNCPSNALTLTPRQRIVINRAISEADKETKELLLKSYDYDGLDTCAACSLCSLSCPVGIDVANLTKHLRGEKHSKFSNFIANKITNHYDLTLKGAKTALKANELATSLIGKERMQKSMDTIRESIKAVPKWSAYIPKASKFSSERFLVEKGEERIVYFPSCISRTFGNRADMNEDAEIFEIVNLLVNRAGYEIVIPKGVEGLCCGTPMSSKGFKDEAKKQLKELENALISASQNGKYPILCDTSPCVKTMIKGFKSDLEVLEPIEFTLRYLAPKLKFKKTDEPVTIHSTCSTTVLGLKEKFVELAQMCSTNVIVPQNVTCCGFAGDRGFSHPELNAKALRWLKSDIKDAKEGFSTSITCELGLSKHSGIPYKSILYLVERVTRR